MTTNFPELSVREIQKEDIELLCNYWLNSDKTFLRNMGVDLNKVPSRNEFSAMLQEQIGQPYKEKKSYCIIWLIDGIPFGHSNINKIKFGEDAFMHLHLWNNDYRNRGAGTKFVNMTLPFFFGKMKLKTLYSEPYSLNPAPHNVLRKTGFQFEKEYVTTPGWINFEQPVKLWKLTLENFLNNPKHEFEL